MNQRRRRALVDAVKLLATAAGVMFTAGLAIRLWDDGHILAGVFMFGASMALAVALVTMTTGEGDSGIRRW